MENRSSEDPYNVMREAIESSLARLDKKYASFDEYIKSGASTSDPKFDKLNRGLTKELNSITATVREVENAVLKVETTPSAYPNISANEIKRRREFVNRSLAKLKRVSDAMKSPRVLNRIAADQRAALGKGKAVSSTMAARDYANDQVVSRSQAQQAEMMKKQDMSLGILEEGVDNLNNMANGIHDEIQQQDKLLDTLDTDVSDAQNRLNQARDKMQALMKTNNKCQFWTIIILFIVALIMVCSVLFS